MQLFDLIIFKFVGRCKLGDLLVQKCNIRLILITQNLFLVCILSQCPLEIANLVVARLARQIQPPFQLVYLFVLLPYYVFVLLLAPLEMLTLVLQFLFLLLHQFLRLLPLIFELFD